MHAAEKKKKKKVVHDVKEKKVLHAAAKKKKKKKELFNQPSLMACFWFVCFGFLPMVILLLLQWLVKS